MKLRHKEGRLPKAVNANMSVFSVAFCWRLRLLELWKKSVQGTGKASLDGTQSCSAGKIYGINSLLIQLLYLLRVGPT